MAKVKVRIKRGTRTQIDNAATSNTLFNGEPYLITDEERMAIGTGSNTYSAMAKKNEIDSHIGAVGDTVHGVVTGAAAGFMSVSDKIKLDTIATGAQVNVPTNLSQGTRTSNSVPINSSTGSSAIISSASISLAGVMSAADKAKLDGISAGAGVAAPTNLSIGTRNTTSLEVTSSTGSSATVPVATTTLAGLLSSTDKVKIDGLNGYVTLTGTETLTNKTLINPVISGSYVERTQTVSTNSTYTINTDNGSVIVITLVGNTTLTFPTITTDCKQFTLALKQDATGTRTVTWPSSVRWSNETVPTLSTVASKVDVIGFMSIGSVWFGFVGGLAFTGT